MMTNLSIQEVTKFLTDETPVRPTYFAVGTGTTAETRTDTALGTELTRDTITFSTEQVLAQVRRVFGSTATAVQGVAIRESGTLSAAAGGTMFDRSVSPSSLTVTSSNNLRMTKFVAFDNSPTSSNNYFMDDGITEILEYYTAGTGTSPTHIGWGTDLILDQADALGAGANAWTDDASAATTPTINTTNTREGTGSINMGKDGVGSAVFYYQKDMAASVDCSSVTRFYLDFRVDNSTDLAKFKTTACLIVRIGSSSGNYKYLEFDKADLIVGWQRLSILVSSMSDTGVPVMSAVDFIQLRMETTNATDTITHGNLLMDYWRGYWPLDVDDTTMHQQIDRNALDQDASRLTSTTARFLSTLLLAEGNTYNYNFAALFDAAASGDMYFSIEMFNERKDSLVQFTTEFQLSVGFYGTTS